MNVRFGLFLAAALITPGVPLLSTHTGTAVQPERKPRAKIAWKKTVVDTAFRSEGVGVADFNKDRKLDLFVGDVWYEAPDWKMHVVRRHQPYDPKDYSEAFGCFADDFNGDGNPDVIVIPFPGKPCRWYENPGKTGGEWKEHLLATSACNETPMYVDLFGTGKKVLVMGWQPPGKDNEGQMCYFTPGKDPTKLWEKHPISEPSGQGKEIPGTKRYSHGLGAGDVNGDGRLDILCTAGWWEQPAKIDGTPWKFHPANLGPNCADMFAYDIDGDGKNDIVSSSAHNTGLWWHQQKPGQDDPVFVRHDFFPPPTTLAKDPTNYTFSKKEAAFYAALNKVRKEQLRAPWRPDVTLCKMARAHAAEMAKNKVLQPPGKGDYSGKLVVAAAGSFMGTDFDQSLAKTLLETHKTAVAPGLEVGIGLAKGADGRTYYVLFLGDRGHFALFGQAHALHLVDLNGDGLKDLVTGRRWWAHGLRGDDFPADPAYLYWFEARRDKNGITTFVPHWIDDDSGVGTQFAIADINGDGLLDIIISNKKGVFTFEQVRVALNDE